METHLHPDCTCTHKPGWPCDSTCTVHRYQAAQSAYTEAYNALAAARQDVKDAEQRFYQATEDLAKLEARPGVPLKAAQS